MSDREITTITAKKTIGRYRLVLEQTIEDDKPTKPRCSLFVMGDGTGWKCVIEGTFFTVDSFIETIIKLNEWAINTNAIVLTADSDDAKNA